VYKATESGDNLKTVDAGKIQLDNDATTYDNLNAAITAASSGSHIITVGAGNYTGTGNVGVTINQGFSNLTIKADEGATVIFDAENKDTPILTINSGNTVTLQGLTFENVNRSTTVMYGALINYGALTVDNCTFLNNKINNPKWGNNGGAAIFSKGATSITITDSNFINNTAQWIGSTAAVSIWGSTTGVSLSNSYFENNTGRFGGAVEIEGLNQPNAPLVNNCIFISNYAYIGGAINLNDGTSNALIVNSTFYNNTVSGPAGSNTTCSAGGAICAGCYNVSCLTNVSNCIFDGNKVINDTEHGAGGAIYLADMTSGEITNSAFNNNSAVLGGAVSIGTINIYNAKLSIENSTFTNNYASTEGGAVKVYKFIKGNITNTTFENNTANLAGALVNVGDLNISSSDFINNNATQAGAIYTAGNINISDSDFINNTANFAGAIMNQLDISSTPTIIGNVTISNSDFINNTAKAGGVMYNLGNTNISDSDFINNTAADMGGVIFNNANVNIINSTLNNNNATNSGGAIQNQGNITIVDSTLNNNNAFTGSAVYGQDDTNLTIKNTVVIAPEGSTTPAVVSTGFITITPILTANDGSVKTGDGAVVKVNVENLNNQTLNGTVTFAVDGNSQTVNIDSDNTATATLSVLSSGAHIVSITYNGEENYTTSNTKCTVTACNYATSITSTELNSVENGTVDVNVASSKTVYTGSVNLIYNNKAIGTAYVKNGVATIDLTGVTPGSYNVTAFYFGKDPFESTSKLLTLTVTASNVTENNIIISVPSISGESGANTIVVVNVMGSDGNVVDSGNVTVVIGNVTYSANVVNGSASVNIILPSTVGVNDITVTYVKGSYSTSVNSTINVINNVTSNVTVLTGDNLSVVYGNGDNYTGKLVDANGNAISGQHIKITLTRVSNGLSKDYWVTTDTNGEYQLEINLGQGLYTAQATYVGAGGYEPSTSSLNSIIVTSFVNGTLLTANTFNQKVNAGQNFTGKLVDSNGNVIAGQHISVNLTRLSNGLSKVYWVTTDTNGEYQLEINLGAGSYTADCSYAGTSTYTSSSAHATLTVTA